MSSEERARREPWGRMEEVSYDAMQMLYEARDGLPDGEAKDEISDWLRSTDRPLDEIVDIAQQVAHKQREP